MNPLSAEFLERCDAEIAKLDLDNSPRAQEARAMEKITGQDLEIRMNT